MLLSSDENIAVINPVPSRNPKHRPTPYYTYNMEKQTTPVQTHSLCHRGGVRMLLLSLYSVPGWLLRVLHFPSSAFVPAEQAGTQAFEHS